MATRAVLFDLDGTLADTAPDLGYALNRLREKHRLPSLPLAEIRPHASAGARGLLQLGFGLRPEDEGYERLRENFLDFYERHLCHRTRLFPGIAELLAEIENRGLPWGVVTNKPARFTLPLLEALGLISRAACVVTADACTRPKPHPEPLLAASRALGLLPEACLYLGDDRRDTEACLAAGIRCIVAGYGYLGAGERPETWNAQAIIETPGELVQYL